MARPAETSSPAGHYVEPSFSPDGRFIVYRHASGDSTRGPFYADDAGIHVVPTAGGTSLLAHESGSDPEFDHTGTRIYIREVRNEKHAPERRRADRRLALARA